MKVGLYEHSVTNNQILFDFHKLAFLAPELRPYVLILNCRTVCNFKDQNSLITLTTAIMKHCFNMEWNCPLSNLCPRIPARLNYLSWVNVELSEVKISMVLDVGTGATLIYPLLGWKVFGWNFIATEINVESFEHSQRLVRLNQLENYIDLRLTPQRQSDIDDYTSDYQDDQLLKSTILLTDKIDVVICNPPFFQQPLQTLTTMTQQQHHIEGGQYTFFFSLYRESYQLPNIQYFTCLVGLKHNFWEIKQFLVGQHQGKYLEEVRFGEILQGNSLRYIVLWRVAR